MDPGIRHIQISTRPQAYYYLGKYNEAYPAKAISWGHPAWRLHAITFRIAWSSSVALAIEVRLVLFRIPLFPAKSPPNCRCTVVEVRYSHSASPAFSGRGAKGLATLPCRGTPRGAALRQRSCRRERSRYRRDRAGQAEAEGGRGCWSDSQQTPGKAAQT